MHKLTLPILIDLTHYQAGSIVFACLDDRFFQLFERLVESLENEQGALVYTDRVITAGGAKDLAAEGTAEQESLFGQIEKSVRLHKTLSIIATTHEDCGAYGDEAKCGGNRREQFLFHLARHREVEVAILARFPEFAGRIRHFYLSVNGAIELDLTREELKEGEINALMLGA